MLVLLQADWVIYDAWWLNPILFILIGLTAGWLAGLLMRGRGFGCLGNVLIGAIGGLIGGVLFNLFGIAFAGLLGSLLTALVGAMALLFIAGLLGQALRR
jgi:uncharacterized membrane protein YeaQ/YmgE (transglycosylase-associated protein family)